MRNKLLTYLYSADAIIRLLIKSHKFYCNIRVAGGRLDLQVEGKLTLPSKCILTFINGSKHSTLGINRNCKISVYKEATLDFLGQFGMSNAVIVATKRIVIGKNVMIGGGTTIVDSDFHSLDYHDWFSPCDFENMKSKEVVIGDNVFIGMNTTILKGVNVGDGAVIAAGSVVTRDIPKGQVWGGNPAKFIRNR